MACPMPREAPVTSAISFSSMGTPSGRRECGVDGGRVLQRQKIQVRAPLDTAVQAPPHPSPPPFDHLRDPAPAEGAPGGPPAHRGRQPPHEPLPALVAGPLAARLHPAPR